MIDIKIGQIWRDTYPDDAKTGAKGKRTVRVVGTWPDGRRIVEVVTDNNGEAPKGKPRRAYVYPKTLRSGYELWVDVK